MNKNLGILIRCEYLEKELASLPNFGKVDNSSFLKSVTSSIESITSGYFNFDPIPSLGVTNHEMKVVLNRLKQSNNILTTIPFDENKPEGLAFYNACRKYREMLEEIAYRSETGYYSKTTEEKNIIKKKELAELEHSYNSLSIPSNSGFIFQIIGAIIIISGITAKGIEVGIVGLLVLFFGFFSSMKRKSVILEKENLNNKILKKKKEIIEIEHSKI